MSTETILAGKIGKKARKKDKTRQKKSLPKIIAVTGTPGTGKTRLSKSLASKKGYLYFDVLEFIRKTKLSRSYDRKRDSLVVDETKLSDAVIMALQGLQVKGAIVDSHLSHFLPAKLVSRCIVTKCGLKTLKKRLARRGYGKAKIYENLQAEIFDVCLMEALEKGHKVNVVWTDKKNVSSALDWKHSSAVYKQFKQ